MPFHPYYTDDNEDMVDIINDGVKDNNLILRDFQDVNITNANGADKNNANINNSNNVDNDDSENYVHDQLPGIEDAIMFNINIGGGRRGIGGRIKEFIPEQITLPKFNLASSRRMVRLWSYGIVVLSVGVIFAAILGLSVHLSTTGEGRSQSKNDIGLPMSNVPADTFLTSMLTRTGLMIDVLSGSVSDPADIADPSSPQRQAITWLATQDDYQIDIPSSLIKEDNDNTSADIDAFLQRYAIAVVAFALGKNYQYSDPTDGTDYVDNNLLKKTVGFFSSDNECRWHSLFERPDDETTVRLGITCNENDEVEKLVLQTLGLNGNLPREIGLLTNMKVLRLDANNITSLLPNHMKHCTKLESLSLTMNHIHGELFDWVGDDLTNLKELQVSHNQFSGAISSSLSKLTDLELLALDHNSFEGEFVDTLNQMTALQQVYLEHNSLDAHLSDTSFDGLPNLRVLDISSNKLLGHFPNNLFKLPYIQVIDLHDNALSGPLGYTIPADGEEIIEDIIPEGCPLQYLDLKENFFHGRIPTTIKNMPGLKHLDLSTNRLEGSFPHNMDLLTDLEYLYLQDNAAFTSQPVPHWLRYLTNLREVSLMDTSLTGSIPNAFEYLTDLRILNLGLNNLNSTIPESLSLATNLRYLLLNRNSLTGTVPSELGSLLDLELFAVDHNFIRGEIGDEVCSLNELDVMVADCGDLNEDCVDCFVDEPAVLCPCCSTCCTYTQEGCNAAITYMLDLSRKWSDPYVRSGHIFTPNEETGDNPFTFIPYSATTSAANNDDDDGN